MIYFTSNYSLSLHVLIGERHISKHNNSMRLLSDIIEEYLFEGNRKKWFYYEEYPYNLHEFRNLDDILNNPGEFVKKYLLKGSKEPEFYEYLDRPEFKYRLTHTVSIFFLGVILYNEVDFLKKCIDKYLISLELEIIEKDPHHECIELPFSYYWFLVCFYHDLGYFSLRNDDVRFSKQGEMGKRS